MRREDTTEEESPEDVRQRNMKEAEMLASNLGEGGISYQDIICDVGQLRALALLQESMVRKIICCTGNLKDHKLQLLFFVADKGNTATVRPLFS